MAKVTEDELASGTLRDGSLLFCNPAAPSVLDPDVDSVTLPESLGSNHHEMSPSSEPRGLEEPRNEPPQSKARDLELTDLSSQVPMNTCCVGHTGEPLPHFQFIWRALLTHW